MEKEFKVLSLDGGGIRGIFTSKILETFERNFSCLTVDYFDLICGTSTGGLIALALSLKIPASAITKFYEDHGPSIFKKRYKVIEWFRKNLSGGKYKSTEITDALNQTFGSHIIGDSNCLLCIPSYSITDARPYIFKFDHPEGKLQRDNNTRYVDVALATTAAPTYFPIVELSDHNNKQLIDGGVYANNPTFIGFTEAFDYFVGGEREFQKLAILSIASLEVPSGKPTGLKKQRALWDWRSDLVNPFMVGQSYTIDFSMKKISEKQWFPLYYRRIPTTVISADQCHLATLDNASPEALDFMKGQGTDQGLIYSKKEEIEYFFKTPKNYKTKTKEKQNG